MAALMVDFRKHIGPTPADDMAAQIISFDTALLEQPFSVMTLCDLPSLWRVTMIVFWTILPSQQSSPLLWFQRTRDTQNLYCMDGHLLKLKCKYSNILRYWTFDFHELQARFIKKLFKCFTLHVMNRKYIKVSLFEMLHVTFHYIQFFLDVPV